MKKQPEWVPIDSLILDPEIQQRWAGDHWAIREYAQALGEGVEFPPLQAVEDPEGRRWVWDGFHRLPAAREAGKTEVLVNLQPGTRRDALLKSCSANQAQGLRRTRYDMRKAVDTLLNDPEWSQLPHREIARLAGVSHTFVNNQVKAREREAIERAVQQARDKSEAQARAEAGRRREAEDARVAELREALVPRLRAEAEGNLIAWISAKWLTEAAALSPEEQEETAARMALCRSVAELGLSQSARGLLRKFHIKTLRDLRDMAKHLDNICWERPRERQEIESKLAEWAWVGPAPDGNVSTPEPPPEPPEPPVPVPAELPPEPPPPPGLDSRIEALEFSLRTHNCLKKAGVNTLAALVQQTEAELMNIRNFGRKSVFEVRDKLAERGLCLPGPRLDDRGEDEDDEAALPPAAPRRVPDWPESWQWVETDNYSEELLWMPDRPEDDGADEAGARARQVAWAEDGVACFNHVELEGLADLAEAFLREVGLACPEGLALILARLQPLLEKKPDKR